MPWPKGLPRKGHVKGSLKKAPAETSADVVRKRLMAIPDAAGPEPRDAPAPTAGAGLQAIVGELAANVARLAKARTPAAVTPRTESLIERLRRIDGEVRAWTDLAHWSSSSADHRAVRAYAKAQASSLRLQAIELVQAHMERLEEYRRKNPVTSAAEREGTT